MYIYIYTVHEAILLLKSSLRCTNVRAFPASELKVFYSLPNLYIFTFQNFLRSNIKHNFEINYMHLRSKCVRFKSGKLVGPNKNNNQKKIITPTVIVVMFCTRDGRVIFITSRRTFL